MNTHEKRTSNKINIAYIGGGSRQWARKIMSDLIIEESISGEVRLYDIDTKAAKKNEVIGNMFNNLPGAKTTWHYKAVHTLKDALEGANFVIISITPGTIEKDMYSDVHTPECYGIYQAVGDTVGPGGYIRALRTIPMYIEIANAIKDYAPDAWVINYTNPMTLCVRTLYQVFPQIKAFGCCHEVFGTQELLMTALNEELNLGLTDRSQIKVNVSGINHFTWIDEAFYKDIDLIPIYTQFANKYYDHGLIKEEHRGDPFKNAHKVKFDLFRRYGVIAAAGDRHLIEFVPQWYLKNESDQEKWIYWLTKVERRINSLRNKNQETNDIIAGKKELTISPSGEEGVQQIKSILGLKSFVSNVNLPNAGQIPWLPKGAVVETNAVFKSGSVKPVQTGNLPLNVQNLVLQHAINQEALIHAFFNQDKQGIMNIFANEPMVKRLSIEESTELFNIMIDNTKAYLPEWLLH
ncbi:family 4 glycosyl hydrolase [Vallitalea okinawensis]|uniref:family 4 glycosyl hydrolase n=1 Tax=Vallitalea okinawensis TaxID=2078660 RepID=UPI000CFCC1C8|nr:alpha-glucosidase/alpha-galactosidase [Vallitalea okinawensis]